MHNQNCTKFVLWQWNSVDLVTSLVELQVYYSGGWISTLPLLSREGNKPWECHVSGIANV